MKAHERKSGGTKRQTRAEQAEATTQTILDAALVCFNRNGSRTTSIEDIAREAGVSRSLIHYHFKTKDDLFMKLQRYIWQAVSHSVQEAVAKLGPSPAHADLGLDKIWNLAKRARPFIPMFLDQMARAATHERLKQRFREHVDTERQRMIEGIQSVMVTPGTSIDARVPPIADLIMAEMIGLWVLTVFSDDLSRSDAAYLEFKSLLAGLATRGQ